MKHLWKAIALVALALFALASCKVFIFSANDLKNKTLTYYSDNGHDNQVLVFDGSGKAGTWTMTGYDYYWPTNALYTAGLVATKTWYKTDGMSGTFTYDPDTGALSNTITAAYGPKSTAVSYGGHYAEADYEAWTIDQYLTDMMGSAVTGGSFSQASVNKLTADNLYTIYTSGTADNTWVSTGSQTIAGTIAGSAFSTATTSTATFTITDGSFTRDVKMVYTTTAGGTTTTDTTEDIYEYSILHNFIVGENDKDDATFADVWKAGNAVTFWLERTRYSELAYTGTTAPTAPTVSTTTGTGTTGSYGVDYYYINENKSTTAYDLTREKDYMLYSEQTLTAGRNLK